LKLKRPNIGDNITVKIVGRRKRLDLVTGKYKVQVTDLSSWDNCFWAKLVDEENVVHGEDLIFCVDEIVKEKKKVK
jgi:hypothetical protein